MKTAQPACLDRRDALASAAPLSRDLVIEEGEARIGELQQPQAQEAGDLDRAVSGFQWVTTEPASYRIENTSFP